MILKWCKENGLQISALKTKIIYWSKSNPKEHPTSITVDGNEFKLSKSVKYLGVIIDDKLNWNEHINEAVLKCKKTFFAVKRAIGKKWGLTPRQMMWIYKTIIIPKITYCSVVWAINMSKTQSTKITTIQTLAQHMITRCKTSTPKVLLDLLLNMEDLPLKIEQTAIKRALALKAENHWNLKKQQSIKYQTTQEKIDWRIKDILKIDPNTKTDKIAPTSIIDKKYTTFINERNDINIKDSTYNLLIFTDGSKDDKGHTGFGIFFSEETLPEISEPLHNFNDIFQAEAIAIKTAAELIHRKNPLNLNIEIYTDSQSVIKTLQKRVTRNEIIHECHTVLNKLATYNKVNINWIPGHQGYEGNEIADKLAKEGSLKTPSSTTYNKIPHGLLCKKLIDHYNNTIINRYKNSGISSESQIITNELLAKARNSTKTISQLLLALKPTKISTLVQILSNHNSLNYHTTKCNRAYNQYCDYCTDVMKECDPTWESNCLETSFHIIYKCRYFSTLRRQIFLKNTIKVNELFTPNLKKSIDKIIEFANKAKFLDKTPQLQKRDLSPNRIIAPDKRKRYNKNTRNDISNPHKKRKTNIS